MRDVDLERLLDGAIDVVFAGRLAEEDVDWEGTTRDREAGSVVVELGELRKKDISRSSGGAELRGSPSRRSS